ncbi:NAD(P)-binding domain-containing protein [Paracraurococcus ruber]|uniref:Oxidoreductase n=1 Tax=Paracraurococcus ruber TaxID=77675 RepID=A0ABS1D4H5_9PROT|nr:NAD(P)/FAD-dependent oxidoreductase [Paracraurococcus ruber]MBK1661766.1 oxidoreductase [Paracraurococcus ruber]TDG31865.1 NAD(P)/FAD-dependent oxidoreductase [Paracraurococcus ruber]
MPAPQSLVELEADLARDLELTAHPRAPWLVPKTSGGRPVLDCLVIGAGQCGLAVAHALKRDKVDNILVVDRAAPGREGPWVTFARMRHLRSPKNQIGPDLKLPSLTYQAWHEAQWGARHFADLYMIPKERWQDYLGWFRRVTGIPVRNGVAAGAIAPARTDDGLPCLAVETSDGPMLARKVVMATGQEGVGYWWMPEFVAALPKALRAHAADAIDFAALAGRVVAVLGAGASAFDNAATALEAGAAEVHLFCRRAEPMDVQPYRWLTFAGFLRHMHEMPDDWRWRFMAKVLGMREGFAQDTYDRTNAHPNFTMHVGRPWTGARAEGGRAVVHTPRGDFAADFLICGTGVRMDPAAVPELARCHHNIAQWQDRYAPPAEEANPRLGEFPYLNADSSFAEKRPGETPWIRDIHLFGIGTSMSFGPAGSSINAMAISAPRVAAGVTRGLFEADLPRLWDSLNAYDLKQVVLDMTKVAAE